MTTIPATRAAARTDLRGAIRALITHWPLRLIATPAGAARRSLPSRAPAAAVDWHRGVGWYGGVVAVGKRMCRYREPW